LSLERENSRGKLAPQQEVKEKGDISRAQSLSSGRSQKATLQKGRGTLTAKEGGGPGKIKENQLLKKSWGKYKKRNPLSTPGDGGV